MTSQLFQPTRRTGSRVAVLVFPEAFGLTQHTLTKAKSLADAGYTALACDLHGDGKVINDRQARMAAIGPLLKDSSRVRARARNALQALLEQPHVDPDCIAAIGFCFGGTMAIELACSGADLKAAIGFHCGLPQPSAEEVAAIKSKILICLGDIDPSVTPQDRARFEATMREASVDWQIHLYGGVVHAFTNPHADDLGMPTFARYDANADKRSWLAMLELLNGIP